VRVRVCPSELILLFSGLIAIFAATVSAHFGVVDLILKELRFFNLETYKNFSDFRTSKFLYPSLQL
jgi:hypothetical protein